MDKTVEVSQAARDAARELVNYAGFNFAADHLDMAIQATEEAFARFEATTRATQPEAALREAEKLPRLTEKMIIAACKAHYGDDNIDGIDLTAADINYSFRQGFKRMWQGVRAALKDHRHG